jgi:hypothetical protein
MLTRSSGLIHAVAYGARSARGSLRGKVVPFAAGTAYLYHQPNRDAFKITDYDVEEYHLHLQEDLRAYYAASVVSEVVWRTYAGGDDMEGRAFDLVIEALAWLNRYGAEVGARPSGFREESASESPGVTHRKEGRRWNSPRIRLQRALILFLWRYLKLLGLQPEPERIEEERSARSGPALSPGSARFLRSGADLPLSRAVDIQLDPDAAGNLFVALIDLFHNTLRSSIKSLTALNGVI